MNVLQQVYSEEALGVDLPSIHTAARRLEPHIGRTELRELVWVRKITKRPILAKFENQQITGSFKFRGALNRLLDLQPGAEIIAASAGNHGLAVTEVAKRLGLGATIFLPTNASPIKKARLQRSGCRILERGGDLEMATALAKQAAKKANVPFISPYNDPLIVAGQGTIALEILRQYPNIGTLLVPAGGGGLLAGCAMVVKALSPSTKVIGVQSSRFSSLAESFQSQEIRRVTPSPTIADGLAVNLELDSITHRMICSLVDDVILVPDESIGVAANALLHHESQLIEPSGAIGLAALLAGAIPSHLISGPCVTILSGGNVSRSMLLKMLTTSSGSHLDEQLLGLVSGFECELEEPTSERAKIRALPSLSGSPSDGTKDCRDELIKNEVVHLNRDLIEFKRQSSEFDDYSSSEELGYSPALGRLRDHMMDGIARELGTVSHTKPQARSQSTSLQQIGLLRALRQSVVGLSELFAWRSSSYDQAIIGQFFDIKTQRYAGVNYDRYESMSTKTLEQQLAKVLQLEELPASILATSSGMAGYSLIESYLLRHVLTPGDTILISSTIYFEASQQLTSLGAYRVVEEALTSEEQVVSAVQRLRPRVLFIDPLSNTPEQHFIDVPYVINLLEARGLADDVMIVIDGTMLSGLLPETIFRFKRPRILYYESGSKYLQLGYDGTMAGFVAVPSDLESTMNKLRRNAGLILYSTSAALFPRYSRELFVLRMQRLTQNALLAANIINSDARLAGSFSACFPLSELHPAHSRASTLQYCGGIVTMSFLRHELSVREALEAYIDAVLVSARKLRIPISKGVSFGFSCPRISAAAAMSETARPFLRLNIGDAEQDSIITLANLLADVAVTFLQRFNALSDESS